MPTEAPPANGHAHDPPGARAAQAKDDAPGSLVASAGLVTLEARLLGVRLERLRPVHYFTEPWDDRPGGTPRVVMIGTLDLATGKETAFSWHRFAEAQGMPPGDIAAHQEELERQVLQAFFRHVQQSPRTRWLHWNMGGVEYGFQALAQRAKALGLGEVGFPERRIFDLAKALKKTCGEDYVPHPRLPNLIQLNGINAYQLLDRDGLTAAFRAGDYARMLRSLLRLLHCLGRIVELLAQGTLRTAGPPVKLSSGPEGQGRAGWMTCARRVLNAGRVPLLVPTPPAGEVLAVAAKPPAPAAADTGAAPAGSRGEGQGAGASDPARRLSETERRILTYCRRKGHKGERIARHLSLSYDHVRRVLARLVRERRLRNTDDGYRTV